MIVQVRLSGETVGEPVRAYGDPVLGAFDLDFFDGGRRRRTTWGSGWGVRFEDDVDERTAEAFMPLER